MQTETRNSGTSLTYQCNRLTMRKRKQQLSRSRNRLNFERTLVLETLEGRLLLAAEVFTDKLDYAPGETVQIGASGFGVEQPVLLQVTRIDPPAGGPLPGDRPWVVVDNNASFDADPDGDGVTNWDVLPDLDPVANQIATSWNVTVEYLNSTLLLTADGGFQTADVDDNLHAEALFTDAPCLWNSSLPTPSTVTSVQFGDMFTYSLPFLEHIFTEGYCVKSTPGEIKDGVVIGTGSSGKPENTNFSGMDDAYPLPSGQGGLPYFSTSLTPFQQIIPDADDPGTGDGSAPIVDKTITWDSDIGALRTFLAPSGGDFVVLFNLNENGTSGIPSDASLDNTDLLIWVEFRVSDDDSSTPDEVFYVSSSDSPLTTTIDERLTGIADSAAGGPDETDFVPITGSGGANFDSTTGFANDERWAMVHSYITVNTNGTVTTSDDTFRHYGPKTTGAPFFDPIDTTVDIVQNLGADQAAFAVFNPDLNDLIKSESAPTDHFHMEIRMSRINNGYEQIFLLANTAVQMPSIDVEKEVSTDGGTTWLDADTFASGPDVPIGASLEFRFIVTNTGNVPLNSVTVTDDDFGPITLPVSSLLPGDSTTAMITVIANSTNFTQVGSDPDHLNTATATGEFLSLIVTDSDVVYVDMLPTVTIVKTADPTSLDEPGGEFTFTLTIHNASLEPVTIESLTDDNTLSTECSDLIGETLAADDGMAGGPDEVSCSYTVTHTDIGEYENTAEVTVSDDEENSASNLDDESVEVIDVLPTVEITKSVTPSELPEPGGEFDFTLTIHNTSVEPVAIDDLTDDNALSAECLDLIGDTLAADDGMVGGPDEVSCSYTVTHTNAGVYENTAEVTVSDDEGNSASDSDDESVEVTDVLPTVDITKSVTPSELPEPGGEFDFTLTIHNTSFEPVTIDDLTDDNTLSAECLDLIGDTLAADDGMVGGPDEVSCSYTVTHTNAGVYENTAEVTVSDDEGNSASDSDDESVEVTDVLPTVEITKSVTPSELPEPGGEFAFTLTIHNTSVEPVTIDDLTDDNALSAECLDLIGDTLAADDGMVGGPDEVSCSYTVTHTNAGIYDNTAEVTVSDDEENSASDSDDESVEVTDVAPTVDITKSVTPSELPEPGGEFDFTLTIHNTSVEPVTIDDLTDDNALSAECLDLIGDTLAADDGMDGGLDEVSCSYTVTHTNAGIYDNTAEVTVSDDEENSASDSDDESVEVTDVLPTIVVTKTPQDPILPYGGTETYTVTVENTSVEPVTITSVVDDNGTGDTGDDVELVDAAEAVCEDPLVADSSFVLAPGVTCTFTFDLTLPVSGGDTILHVNTVTALGEDDEGNPAEDDATATVRIVQPFFFTNTEYCQYDYDATLPGDQFRLLFIQDAGGYRLNSNNPGQFYDNAFYAGDPGDMVTLSIQVPFPFVTNGAVPIHVYDSFGIVSTNIQSTGAPGFCFTQGTDVTHSGNFSIKTYSSGGTETTGTTPSGASDLVLSDYGTVSGFGATVPTTTVVVTGQMPATGHIYVTVHLQYGLKGTTKWTKTDSVAPIGYDEARRDNSGDSDFNDAVDYILNGPQTYTSTLNATGGTFGDVIGATDSTQSVNIFKKSVGVAGTISETMGGDPQAGASVRLYGPNSVANDTANTCSGSLIETQSTDVDGSYAFNYKHTGSQKNFCVLASFGSWADAETVPLKANGFAIEDFYVGQALHVVGMPTAPLAKGSILTATTAFPAVREAVNYWTSQGFDSETLQRLGQPQVQIANLGDEVLGLAIRGENVIKLDADAGGFGWYTNLTGMPNSRQVDLFSVLVHEVGHLLGFDHSADLNDLMGESLEVGARFLPRLDDNLKLSVDSNPFLGSVDRLFSSLGGPAIGTNNDILEVDTLFDQGDLPNVGSVSPFGVLAINDRLRTKRTVKPSHVDQEIIDEELLEVLVRERTEVSETKA